MLQEEGALALVDALLEHDALELLMQRLTAFDESVADEETAVFNTLGIFENFTEVKPETADAIGEKTKVRVSTLLDAVLVAGGGEGEHAMKHSHESCRG